MTVVGVVSDTHLPRFGPALPPALVRGLEGARVDRILHAGDLTAAFVVDALAEIAPVDAVAGNNDPAELHDRFGTAKVLEIAGVPIGLTHGHLGAGRTTPQRAVRAFGTESVDLVVFGHSHQPLWIPRTPDRSVPALLNPGSPTDRRRERTFSFAILTVDGDRLDAEIVRFADRTR